MYIKTLKIENFRAIESVDVELTSGTNVIVGPNAIGKTTILEAIRLAKALLAPRANQESQQVLMSLGVVAAHNPQLLMADAIVRTPDRPLKISCGYQLDEGEVKLLQHGTSELAVRLLQQRVNITNSAQFAPYLSSPDGQRALSAVKDEITQGLKRLEQARGVCRLDLVADLRVGQITTPDPIGAAFLQYIEQSQSPEKTKFSYFPADRALPKGEQPIQLGSPEASLQLESHNSQPQTKYNRLKNTIFGAIVSSDTGREDLIKDFNTIFRGFLKGREIVGAGINQWGMLSTIIKDSESGRVFDIDAMSSGEKGVILTFLLIARSLSNGGIVLLDEPELHLNPAVCKDLLPFAIDNYASPKRLQLIICSHSPEILAGAFDREECALFHLLSGTMLTRVRRTDEAQIHEALRRLGTSESEGLLYKATIFVEGEHDVDILEHGFGGILRQYRLKDLGGRREVEKQIVSLQRAEENGENLTARYFIFDKDDAPTSLKSSRQVRLVQWDRRCLENYLIEIDALADLLMDQDITQSPVQSVGHITADLKSMALKHLDDFVVSSVYSQYKYTGTGHRPAETHGRSFSDAGKVLFSRISQAQSEICNLDEGSWLAEFEAKCTRLKDDQIPIWDTQWRELCDGKRLFKEIQKRFKLRLPILAFKRRVVERMRNTRSDNWRAIEGLLKGLIGE